MNSLFVPKDRNMLQFKHTHNLVFHLYNSSFNFRDAWIVFQLIPIIIYILDLTSNAIISYLCI